MKKIKNKAKKIDLSKILYLIDRFLEHHFFKPVVISIITIFVIFKGFEFLHHVAVDYHEKSIKKRKITPIKINISENGVKFDIDEEQSSEYVIKSGDTLLKILFDAGVSEGDIFSILTATKKVFDPRYIVSGNVVTIKYQVQISYDPKKQQDSDNINRHIIVNSLTIAPSVEEHVVVSRKSNGEYDARKVKIKLLRYISKYSGTITSGLFVDGVEAGVSPNTVMNMINLYSYDVDFQRDIRSGNKFEIVVESFYSEDGKKVKDGNILFSSLTLQNRTIDIYMHKIKDRAEYFDEKGNSVRKSLLRTPISGARVSSRFGMRRHPVLGYSRMHKGVDFAAPRGTPIYAAGSGKIVYMGRYGGYGNYVKIKHNSKYSTAYAHASRFNRRLRRGSRVKQGDVIAYVGTTGRSTGPHLHYEVVRNGRQINPSKVKATSGSSLKGRELAKFKESKAEIDKYRKNIPNQIKP